MTDFLELLYWRTVDVAFYAGFAVFVAACLWCSWRLAKIVMRSEEP